MRLKLKIWTVSEINRYISGQVDIEPIFKNLTVKGEVSNCKSSGGHVYFALKDGKNVLNSIAFRSSDKMSTLYKNGNMLVCQGKLNYYKEGGKLNFIVNYSEIEGKGELYADFLKTKEKLKNEGLFDLSHKKTLPYLPLKVGVITSETGAVIHDIINVMRNRFHGGNIILYPSKVQGNDAAKSVIKGIDYFNSRLDTDVIIIARGGGSFEDLNAFNDEELAYKVYESKIPVVSAIGHESDFTILDFVCDVRASTPSNASEIVFPVTENIENKLLNIKTDIHNTIFNKLYDLKHQNELYKSTILGNSPKHKFKLKKNELHFYLQNINSRTLKIYDEKKSQTDLKDTLNSEISHIIFLKKSKLKTFHTELMLNPPSVLTDIYKKDISFLKTSLNQDIIKIYTKAKNEIEFYKNTLDNLSISNILKKGFALLFKGDKRILKISELKREDEITLMMSDGKVKVKVINTGEDYAK